MANNLTKTHCTALEKVAIKLAYNQKMDGKSTQLIMNVNNREKFADAKALIYKAINILQQVN